MPNNCPESKIRFLDKINIGIWFCSLKIRASEYRLQKNKTERKVQSDGELLANERQRHA